MTVGYAKRDKRHRQLRLQEARTLKRLRIVRRMRDEHVAAEAANAATSFILTFTIPNAAERQSREAARVCTPSPKYGPNSKITNALIVRAPFFEIFKIRESPNLAKSRDVSCILTTLEL